MGTHYFRQSSKRLKAGLAVLLSIELSAPGLRAQSPALPNGGVVAAGSAQISTNGSQVRIDQSSARAIIDWRSFAIGAGGQVVFVQPSADSATLNRVTGDQVSVILGRLDANGHVFLVNPNGIVFGHGAQVNVGSLVASTSNLTDANFMAGRLTFDEPGRPGAGILNAGNMTAAEGGLIALVAPHVRNDGIIVARLGKVLIGAADTFTVDLYGDSLINLALSDANAGQLHTATGEPVTSLITNTGTIDASGGQTVLMTARNAKSVLDNLINMSGVIKADSAVQQGGRILLLGEGGKVDVSGTLSARGTTGGSIDVLGDAIHLGSTTSVDAGGANGGGIIHVGGAFQGQGDTYRATTTTVDAGASLKANADDRGNGGEVVVWSTGHTEFAGAIEAKGGANAGDGGRTEVSGKDTLTFLGQVDASAAAGQPGSLLLDPAFLNIGPTEAAEITRVLRTGTSTTLAADVDINVNSAITGGDRAAGGGLTMTAQNNINVNDFIETNNGAINLFATQGTVNIAAGKAIFAGTAPITVRAGGTLHTGSLFTSGPLAITSTAGSVELDSFIDNHTGPVTVRAAGNVDINQPIVSLASGAPLDVAAGQDINVNAQVDGRGGEAGGAVTMTASRNLNVNESIVTNNGGVTLTATNGTMSVGQDKAIISGTGAIAMTAAGNIVTGGMSGGSVTATSTGGSIDVNGLIDGNTGRVDLRAANDVDLNQPVLNSQSGNGLTVTAGQDVNVNAQIDGRGGAAGGAVALSAGRNLNVDQWVVTNNGAITLDAAGGTATVAADKGLVSGTGAITTHAGGDLTTAAISGGSFKATSGASVFLNGVIDGTTGRVDVTAARDVQINQPILSPRTGSPVTVTAGRDIAVNAAIDGTGGAPGGSVTLTASHDVTVNNALATNNGPIAISATSGAVSMSAGGVLASGRAPIALTAGGDVTTGGISAGSLSAASTGGSVNVNGLIDGNTGQVDLSAARDVNINQPILNLTTGAPLTATAGDDINVNAPLDGSTAVQGGSATLSAGRSVTVNAPVATHDGAISITAASGAATVETGDGLFAGTGAISMKALGTVTTGTLSGGPISLVSSGGSVALSGAVSGNGGPIAITAATEVDITHAITNPGTSSPLTITAGTDVNVNAPIDGRSASNTQSSPVNLTAAGNVNLNSHIDTTDAPISVTATNGAVASGANAGLFAGSGSITVQSGQTLSTGITSTTGALTFRSTNGSVDVDTAISGTTGALTISAANDVNVNQAIANPRNDAPLTVSAGHDINVNASIDGRDVTQTIPSGTITMTAGNDIAVNQSIVSRDSAISLTAQNGSLVAAPGMGLFAGSGAISETSGQTLNTGITSTTGSLSLRSTQGGVNINTAIDDTTGAVNVAAATTVNINQPITNLKTGNNLAITAGSDINVLAQVDGRNGVAGGSVTMTAGNNLAVTQPIATNDGAVALTATAGSVTVPTGTENFLLPMQWIVSAGSAPVTITSGSNFSLNSPIDTTGSLTISSTHGNVNIAAPITDNTGAVTISAGNGITVNHQVKSNSQPITLTAGAGGITVNPITDFDQTFTSPVNSGNANLTFNSVGDVAILDSRGIASTGNVTIDTRGRILSGSIGDASTNGQPRPQSVVLNADGGIASFVTGYAGSVTATSSGGSISLVVAAPGKLRITTGTPGTTDCPACDINLASDADAVPSIGPDVALNAGGSVNLSPAVVGTLDVTARSGDINFSHLTADHLTATAGRDVNLTDQFWMSSGAASLTAGRNIVTTASSPIHVSDGQTLTLTAGQNVTLNLLESLGALNITATNGNVTLNNDIGPHIINNTGEPDFNPSDLGVASLSISAPASTAAITMQGARAEGNVTITTGGSLTAAKQITSVGGTVTITTGVPPSLSAIPIGNQDQIYIPGAVSPVIAPGPRQPLPTAPGFVSSSGPGAPALAEISVAPADAIVAGVASPGAVSGRVGVPGTPQFAEAPGGVGGSTTAGGSPTGAAPPDTSGVSSEPGNSDTAAALRDAQQGCGKDRGRASDTGLNAVKPEKGSGSSDTKTPSCATAAAAAPRPGASASTTPPPSGTPTNGQTAPAVKPGQRGHEGSR
jgi:filamentous hemagglutinin family protein